MTVRMMGTNMHQSIFLMKRIVRAVNYYTRLPGALEKITASDTQSNHIDGVQMSRVVVEGDATVYRLILAPENAPIKIDGIDADRYFAEPLVPRDAPMCVTHDWQPSPHNDHVEVCGACDTRRAWTKTLAEIYGERG